MVANQLGAAGRSNPERGQGQAMVTAQRQDAGLGAIRQPVNNFNAAPNFLAPKPANIANIADNGDKNNPFDFQKMFGGAMKGNNLGIFGFFLGLIMQMLGQMGGANGGGNMLNAGLGNLAPNAGANLANPVGIGGREA
jgi:hypothetical protein